jgi:hypothetical protein
MQRCYLLGDLDRCQQNIFCFGRLAQELREGVIRDAEGACEFRPGPRLRTGLTAFPAHDGCALDPDRLGQPLLLTEAGRLACED